MFTISLHRYTKYGSFDVSYSIKYSNAYRFMNEKLEKFRIEAYDDV